VDRIAVDRADVALSSDRSALPAQPEEGSSKCIRSTHFLVIIKDTVAPEWAGAGHMPVRQNVSLFRIDHESRGLAARRQFGIEGTCLAKMDGHYAFHYCLNRCLPFESVWLSGHHR
jgi:hypothetical protein